MSSKQSLSKSNIEGYNSSFLSSVYSIVETSTLYSELEQRYNICDESSYFKNLVNTTISRHQPFHRWIRYREGYAGELVKEILSRYPTLDNSGFVLDPMCGSGSTSVACIELNTNSIGFDVNPYAILSTKIKTIFYTRLEIQSIRDFCSDIKTKRSISAKFNEYDSDVSKYFDNDKLTELVKIKNHIKTLTSSQVKDFLWLGLLGSLEDCSNRKKDGNGLATRESKISSSVDRFIQQINLMLEDIIRRVDQTSPTSIVEKCSALQLDRNMVGNGVSIQSIIFSPPYANSFDYYESYKIELIFGEYTLARHLKAFRKDLIRNYRLGGQKLGKNDNPIIESVINEIELRIPLKEQKTGKKDGRTRLVPNMIRAYFSDMNNAIRNCTSILEQGAYMHIVVDQSAYLGVPIPTDLILANIAEKYALEVTGITVCRSANTSGQQLREYPYLKHLLRESIITLKKR